MSVNEKLEKAGRLFWDQRADFFLAYGEKDKEKDHELKWILAWSLTSTAREDCEKLAAKYYSFAEHHYRRKRDEVFEEVIDPLDGTWKPIGPLAGKLLRAFQVLPPTPANHDGERWWQLVVASGETREAGYIIVTRVAAKDREQVFELISKTQAIMRTEDEEPDNMPRS